MHVLRKVVHSVDSLRRVPLLRKAQLACMQRLDEQLVEMIRKHNYRFKDEARGAGMVSWKRVAGLIAGEDERVEQTDCIEPAPYYK